MSNTKSTKSGSATYRRLFSYVFPYRKAFILAIICNVAYGFVDVQFVRALEPLLDVGLYEKDVEFLSIAPYFVLIALILRGTAGFVAAYCMSWIGNNMIMVMRGILFNQYISLPARFFDSNKSGGLISTLTFNTEQLNRSTTEAVTVLVRNLAIIIFAIWSMLVTDWELTILFLIAAPLIAFLVTLTSRRFRDLSRRIQVAMGDITQVTQESVESYQAIKIYGGQEHEGEKFARVNNQNRRQTMKMEITKALSIPVIQFLAGIGLALVLYFATSRVVNGSLTPGSFVMMLSMMMLILKPLKSLSSVNAIFQRGIAAAESVFDIIDESPEKDEGVISLSKAVGDIHFTGVNFQYDSASRLALNNINLEIPAGKTIALVGRSGSGKSTLASILLRFYNIDSGKITLDGVNIEDYVLADYREQIAYVSQHVTLFNETIGHNIAYGKLGKTTEEAIIDAAKKAHAWEFINELPEGLNTMVGEKGMLLSGGQRQRLAIARAILKDAPILILDEATSALDTESEKYIQQAMNTVMENRTTVVVAHRLSTIENADQILVMDKGQIVETGTHLELLKQAGTYAALHQMQFKD
ncbi:MAG: subfamily B ATP-binding cassette protein MsbA [Enterobacterales bacterium]|jgi:subfamily B ATP-binding cassette protein MsbA